MKKLLLSLVFLCCIPVIYKASGDKPNPQKDFLNSEKEPPFTASIFQNPRAFITPDGERIHFLFIEGPYRLQITLGPKSDINCQHTFTPPALALTQQPDKDDTPLERRTYHSAACEKPACMRCLFFLFWFSSKMTAQSLKGFFTRGFK